MQATAVVAPPAVARMPAPRNWGNWRGGGRPKGSRNAEQPRVTSARAGMSTSMMEMPALPSTDAHQHTNVLAQLSGATQLPTQMSASNFLPWEVKGPAMHAPLLLNPPASAQDLLQALHAPVQTLEDMLTRCSGVDLLRAVQVTLFHSSGFQGQGFSPASPSELSTKPLLPRMSEAHRASYQHRAQVCIAAWDAHVMRMLRRACACMRLTQGG